MFIGFGIVDLQAPFILEYELIAEKIKYVGSVVQTGDDSLIS